MIALTDQALDPGAELNRFCEGRAQTGAVASFVGLARGAAAQGAALELEAYPGFTEAEIGKIAQAATNRFALHDVAITHRVGRIAAGEAIVMILTAAAHRREAFEACDYLMDYLKSRAPLWKQEHGPTGPRWVEPTARDAADLARWDDAPEKDFLPPLHGEGRVAPATGVGNPGQASRNPPEPHPSLRATLPMKGREGSRRPAQDCP